MAGPGIIISSAQFGGGMRIPNLPMENPLSTGRQRLGMEVQAAQQMGQIERQNIASATQAEQAGLANETRAQSAAIDAEQKNVTGLASAVSTFADTLQFAVRTAKAVQAKADYAKGLNELQTQISQSGDYENAATTFENGLQTLRENTVGKLWQPDAQAATLDVQRQTIAAQNRITTFVADRTGQAANAAYMGTLLPDALNRASNAKSPVERQAAYDEHDRNLEQMVRVGQITASEAQSRIKSMRMNVEEADFTKRIQDNPASVLADLNDPAKFPTYTPQERAARQAQAQAALDTRETLRAGEAAKANPLAAQVTYGHKVDRSLIPQIVDKALIPQESGGNPNAVSGKGAAGITQFMPATAVAVAAQMGRKDFVGLSDAQVRQKLQADPALARQMTIFHLNDLVTWFDGKLPAALAAYHAGAGNAAKAHEKALAAFGPEYTAAQYASQLPDTLSDGAKRTKDYVLDLYGRMGADAGRNGVSINASYRTQDAVRAALNAENAATRAVLDNLVKGATEDANSIAAMFKDGYVVNPARMAEVKAPLVLAAQQGNAQAQQQLRVLAQAEEMAPVIQQAWQMPVQERDTQIAALRNMVANSGDPSTYRRLQILEKVNTEAANLARTNPFQLLERSSGIKQTAMPPPLMAGTEGFATAVMMRAQAASMAQERYKTPFMMFDPTEKETYKQAWQDMGPKKQADMLMHVRNSIEAAVPQKADQLMEAFVGQISGNAPEMRLAGMVSGRDPALAQDILNGLAILQGEGGKIKAGEIRNALAAALPPNLYSAETGNMVTDAALAVYAAERARFGKVYDPGDKKGMQAAIERIAGRVVSINGEKTMVPPAMEQKLRDVLFVANSETLQASGLAKTYIDENPRYFRENVQLIPAGIGDGRYRLAMPSGKGPAALLNADGKPLTIVVPELYQRSLNEIAKINGLSLGVAGTDAFGFMTGMTSGAMP